MPKLSREIKPGDRFGDWEAIALLEKDQKGNRFWSCKCHGCDRDGFRVSRSNLLSGKSTRCKGCKNKRQSNPINVGDRFGDWEVTKFLERDPKTRHLFFECKCHGCDQNGFKVRGSSLRDGSSSQCLHCSNSGEKTTRLMTHADTATLQWLETQGPRRQTVEAAIANFDLEQWQAEQSELGCSALGVYLTQPAVDKVEAIAKALGSKSAAIQAAIIQAKDATE